MAGIDRRRPKWIGWIPAAAMSTIIIAVVITTMVLMAGGLGQEPGEPTADEATEGGASLFTDDGLRYIHQTRKIKLDLRNVPMEAAAFGLPEDGDVTIGPGVAGPMALPYAVMLRTPGGTDVTKLEAYEATITTAAGLVTEVRSQAIGGGFRDALALLWERADEFGYVVETEQITAGMGDAVRAGRAFHYSVGPGEALGASTTVDLTCDESTSCTVVFKITPGVG